MKPQEEKKNPHLTEAQRVKFRLWLNKQFTDRVGKNPRYSLRAFAGVLAHDPSSVSQFLSGKRAPSRNAVVEICQRLSATPRDLKLIGVAPGINDTDEAFQLSIDTFSVMSDWYHFAVLELTFVENFKSDPAWIASQLKISVVEARAAIERLLRLGLLKAEGDTLIKTHAVITNDSGINSSAANKELQRQVINKALKAIDEVAQNEKEISSMTMPIDPKNLGKASELTKAYRRDMCALLATGEMSQVYNLAIQLYPVSKKSE
jgi:hypothetical protein